MHFSIFGVYLYDDARGFYLGKIGNSQFDSSLLGVHWSTEYEESEHVMYSIFSFDVCYLALLRETAVSFMDLFKKDKDKDKEE